VSISEKEAHNRFLAGIETGIESESERTRQAVYEFQNWCRNKMHLYSESNPYEAKRYLFWLEGTGDLLEMLYGANYEEKEAYQG
jgi:hypothetical protein